MRIYSIDKISTNRSSIFQEARDLLKTYTTRRICVKKWIFQAWNGSIGEKL